MSKENTVVCGGDRNYFWGMFMMIASMRFHGMDEPVLVYATDFPGEYRECLEALGDVRIVSAPSCSRSLTCQKPEALLLVKTSYATWVDCDGFFTGNCSELLVPDTKDMIHVRLRSNEEGRDYLTRGKISAEEVLEQWRIDVGDLEKPRYSNYASACYLSIPTSYRPFLELWHSQMRKVLPDGDVGVVDHRSEAYWQTDESVLNSVLCFSRTAPEVTPTYHLDKNPDRLYVHFVSQPKPWVSWTNSSLNRMDSYLRVAEYVLESGYRLPENKMPFSINPAYRMWNRVMGGPMTRFWRAKRLWRKFLGTMHSS